MAAMFLVGSQILPPSKLFLDFMHFYLVSWSDKSFFLQNMSRKPA
jgi:hypothetical protein